MNPFDTYNLRARMQPALLLLLPVALAVIAWVPIEKFIFGTIWSLLGLTGFTFLLAQLARDKGRQIEPAIWAEWGGKPTTQLLRHASAPNKVTLSHYHAKLARILGKRFPTEAEERENPIAADEIYDAAVAILRSKRRDSRKYPLIFQENVNYGFRRNLYAMRTSGVFISVVSVLSAILGAVLLPVGEGSTLVPWVCAAINALLLSLWILRFNSDWVRLPAFAYAERLLESTTEIEVEP